ncbi:MAG TPA: hypothetical protein VGR64_09425 [Terracidiphilus sp.]|nr:hypothetical protein [Terracidiphilus sp.]
MRGWARWMGVLAVVSLYQLPVLAQGGQPATGIDAVQAYRGTWKVETEHFNTAHSKAGQESRTLHNDCWRSGGYFACNQYVDGDSKVLIVFTYDATAKVYHSYQIPQGGGEPGHGTMTIAGNEWTFPWQMKDGDTTTYFRVVNVFDGPDRIEYRQEYSPDKVHWTSMARGTETRVSRD